MSLPRTLVTLVLVLRLSSLNSAARSSAGVTHTFVDPDVEGLNHLVVDKITGKVFVGGVNKLYQLSPDLDLVLEETTGPKNDSSECALDDCPADAVKTLTDDVNKALVIDYSSTRLISCGSLFQGTCTVRNLHNISDVTQEVREAVVANDAASSTVAFIAPGPPNPPVSQVMYVGVTHTANSPYRLNVPAMSTRSLEKDRMFTIAETSSTSGTRMFASSVTREQFPINYVYGFSSNGFSYFLTVQPKNTTTGTEFISKLVRVCHADENYYSYTEIPIDCAIESRKYNLVQAAYVGKAGAGLAEDLGITVQDDVLFAVFSESEPTINKPSSKSAMCVYSLKAIQRKFTSNIQHCFAGEGQTGSDHSSPSRQCVAVPQLQYIGEHFCGLDINTFIRGEDAITAAPVMSFDEHLTAIAATSTDNNTLVFVGTSDGHLKKILVETETTATKYGDLEVDPGSPVNSDLNFDPQSMHLYVMTKQKVSKVDVHECSVYKTCLDCLTAKDSYCGWCLLENECNLRSDCPVIPNTPLHWLTRKSDKCPTIKSVTPDQLQRTTASELHLVIEDLPRLTGRFRCAFSALNSTLITDATRDSDGVKCDTPQIDFLPLIPQGQQHYTADLSLRRTTGPDLVVTKFTFFDCGAYSSCTQCVTSRFPCDFCIEHSKCTHDIEEYCPGDILVNRVSSNESTTGPEFCPRITGVDSPEILVPSGLSKAVHVKVYLVGHFIVQTRFTCRFNIEDRAINVTARLLADTIYCDPVEFSYTSSAPNITVPFAVFWGGSKSIDNPANMHIVVYRCSEMADDCDTCQTLDQKYDCGWCQSSNKCEIKEQCGIGSGVWLNRNRMCPSS